MQKNFAPTFDLNSQETASRPAGSLIEANWTGRARLIGTELFTSQQAVPTYMLDLVRVNHGVGKRVILVSRNP